MEIPIQVPVEPLIDWDHSFFQIINSGWSHPWLDISMPILTDLHRNFVFMTFILPVILGVYLYVYRKLGVKVILCMAVAVYMADTLAYKGIKNLFPRERPEKVLSQINLRTHTHSGPSFPSNHAANVFAGAFVLHMAHPKRWYLFYALATLVAFSRVYVGVHFPSDVIAGMVVGLFCGMVTTKIWMHFYPETFYRRFAQYQK